MFHYADSLRGIMWAHLKEVEAQEITFKQYSQNTCNTVLSSLTVSNRPLPSS